MSASCREDRGFLWWWEEEAPPRPAQRDAMQLWWQTYLWLARHGWLITVPVPTMRPRHDQAPAPSPRKADFWHREESVREALRLSRGVQKDAAQMLGTSSRMIAYYIRKFDLYDLCTSPACRPGNRLAQRQRFVQRSS